MALVGVEESKLFDRTNQNKSRRGSSQKVYQSNPHSPCQHKMRLATVFINSETNVINIDFNLKSMFKIFGLTKTQCPVIGFSQNRDSYRRYHFETDMYRTSIVH